MLQPKKTKAIKMPSVAGGGAGGVFRRQGRCRTDLKSFDGGKDTYWLLVPEKGKEKN